MVIASLIFSFIDNTSAQHLFSVFGSVMMIYSGMNINERYSIVSEGEVPKAE